MKTNSTTQQAEVQIRDLMTTEAIRKGNTPSKRFSGFDSAFIKRHKNTLNNNTTVNLKSVL